MSAALSHVAIASIRSHWRIIAGLWTVHVLLAAAVVAPFGTWAIGAIGTAVEAGKLTEAFDTSVVSDIVETAGGGELMMLLLTVALAVLAAALASAFIAGGVISRVGSWPGKEESFSEAGVRYFWPNLRILGVVAVVGGLLAVAINALLKLATRPLVESLSEAGSWTRLLLPLIGAGLAMLFAWLVLQFARIRLVATGERRAVSHVIRSAGFVMRHVWATAGWWLLVACAVVAGLAVCIAVCRAIGGPTWPQIVAVSIVQQLFMMWRAAAHVGLVAGQVAQAKALGLVVPVPEWAPSSAAGPVPAWPAVPISNEGLAIAADSTPPAPAPEPAEPNRSVASEGPVR